MSNLIFSPSQTTHWKNLFPTKTMLLGSHNLNEGEELVAKIVEIKPEAIKDQNGKEEVLPVLKFENAPPMVLNITNTRTIASLYGERYDQWQGKSIQLFAAKVKAFGVEQTALRVRPVIPETGEDITHHIKALENCSTIQDLQKVFMAIPKHIKPMVAETKDKKKGELNESN